MRNEWQNADGENCPGPELIGEPLNQWCFRFPGGIVPVEQAYDIMAEVAAIVDEAHGRNECHLNLKPENISVETDSNGSFRVRVIGFGTIENEVAVSPYLAPEQWSGGQPNGRTDVYAVACLLYGMLSGAPPLAGAFETGDLGIMSRAVAVEPPEPIEGLEPVRNEILLKALSKKQEDRFHSCIEFLNAFADPEAAGFFSSVEVPDPMPPPQVPQKYARSGWIKSVAIGVAIILGLGAFYFIGAIKSSWKLGGQTNGLTRTIVLPGGATMDLVWVPAGKFTMGSDDSDADGDEQPIHVVKIKKGFWMGKYEVTQAQWKSVMGDNPSKMKVDNLPVENVSWEDCMDFIEKVNMAKPQVHLALPTEAQWEYAAKGGSKGSGFKYSGGDEVQDVAWFAKNSGALPTPYPIGWKTPNELGLYDMSGNVSEWCRDRFGEYSKGKETDPAGPASGTYRVCRGGAYLSSARDCRSSFRFKNSPNVREDFLGFRVIAAVDRDELTEFDVVQEGEAVKKHDGSVGQKKDAWMGNGYRAGELKAIKLPGGAKMDLVWVSPGSFNMENNDSGKKPVHKVTFTKGYWIGKTEVTRAQWRSVMNSNPSNSSDDALPEANVSWEDCQRFVKMINFAHPEFRLSLPTEAQWEFAARGGTKSKGSDYAGGNDVDAVAWHHMNSYSTSYYLSTGRLLFSSHVVGTKQANELGIFDMSGNVSEWCEDWYGDYSSKSESDPTGPDSGDYRVLRGGSWRSDDGNCRSASRSMGSPNYRGDNVGFRVVASAGP